MTNRGDTPQVVYFVNSGSEANDLAMLMARAHTRNFDIISLRNGYHGMNPYIQGATALSTWRYNVPLGHGIHHVRVTSKKKNTKKSPSIK